MSPSTVPRFLVTTADQRSWPAGTPLLFLGEWCRRYPAKAAWASLDALVAAPYGVDSVQKWQDHVYIYQKLLPELQREVAGALNAFHGCAHTERYWQILVGMWLQNYTQTLFNRYRTVEQALDNYAICGTRLFNAPNFSLATVDTRTFVWASNDDVWNHVLYGRVINEFGGVPVEPIPGTLDERGFVEPSALSGADRGMKPRVLRAANSILPLFARKTDAFIINSYLPKKVEAGVSLALGQCPQAWTSPSIPASQVDRAVRAGAFLDGAAHSGFEKFVRAQLVDAMPSCFLEGYGELVRLVESQAWPATPRFILTSNSFAYDEAFKLYAARQTERGTRYFVGAHGSFGVSPYVEADETSPEVRSSDRYLTWGWSNGDPRFVPAFNFKVCAQRARPAGHRPGGLLLIECIAPQRKTHWDSYFEFGTYQEEQFRFVDALPESIRGQLTVRLHGSHRRTGWGDEERWRDHGGPARIELGLADIRGLFNESRLVVHSYDSTGLPETLTLNIPTMCFWQGGLDHIFPAVRPFYERLRDAGILADSPEQAAALIAARWDNLEHWWRSAPVQDARRAFCDRISRTEPRPVRAMVRLLVQACRATASAAPHARRVTE